MCMMPIFWVKSSIILRQFKNKIIINNFLIFVATKKDRKTSKGKLVNMSKNLESTTPTTTNRFRSKKIVTNLQVCGVAQLVARRAAVRRPRVRISARHPIGGPLPERTAIRKLERSQRMSRMNVLCMNVYNEE